MSVVVRFRRLREGAAPAYMTAGAAGFDLSASLPEPVTIGSGGKRRTIPTGIALEIPPGYEGQVRPRSGLARSNGVTLANAPGTIDSDYRGEIEVLLVNHGEVDFVVKPGMRIAQVVIAPVVRAELVEVDALGDTDRGAGGFGSTG